MLRRAFALPLADAAAAAVVAAAFAGWAAAAGEPARAAWAWFFPLVGWALVATGDAAERLARRTLAPGLRLDPAAKLLAGVVAASSVLYVAAWLSPLHAGGNALAALGALVAVRALLPADAGARPPAAPGLGAVAFAVLAATLWSQDAIAGLRPGEPDHVARTWVDGFVHASLVRTFRDAHGPGTIEDVRAAGEPARPYHYAGYALPALEARAAGVTPLAAYGALLVPLGVVAAGLGAHVLVASCLGGWAGLAAAVAALALPDAGQHGARAAAYGAHWLVQVSPTLGLGAGVLALAAAAVIAGTRRGRVGWVAAGLALGAWAVNFKAQLALAGALPLAVYPALLFPGLRRRARLAALAAIAAGVAAAALVSARVPTVPELRVDPASTKAYLSNVLSQVQWPPLARAVGGFGPGTSRAHDLLAGGLLMAAVTFGLLAVAFPLAAALAARRGAPGRRALVYPALVAANFLATSLLLALDRRGVGTADELLHRPFVWAWWVVAAFTAGAAWAAAFRDGAPRSAAGRACAVLAACAALAVPWRLGPGVQLSPGWSGPYAPSRVPAGLADAAAFLRARAAPADVVQDSAGDPQLALAALSERRPLAADYFLGGTWRSPALAARLEAIRALRAEGDPVALAARARALGLTWYVARPDDAPAWPAGVLENPAFASRGYRVYRLRPE